MDEKIELAPMAGHVGENGVQAGRIGNVAMAGDEGAEFGRQRLDAFPERLALIGQRDFGAVVDASLGDAVGDRPIVGDAQDEAALTGHEALSTRHNAVSATCFCLDSPIAQARGAFKLQTVRMAAKRSGADVPLWRASAHCG